MEAQIAVARKHYHESLVENGVLSISESNIPSNADSSSNISRKIALHMAQVLHADVRQKVVGQTSGAMFELITMNFLQDTFPNLQNLRPGNWHIERLGNRNEIKTEGFVQYEHLAHLSSVIKSDPRLQASLGNDYMVAPDIVIYRDPVSDEIINQSIIVVNENIALQTDVRAKNNNLPILHASISAKWTMRSDRAQNSRTEALNLIRNRKGHLPHIVVVTGEPLPGRIASLALGTGDIDCTYHFALYELVDAVQASGSEESIEMLSSLIQGKRLKDISDLPLDLSV